MYRYIQLISSDSFVAFQRICSKDYKIPDSNFTVPKGMIVNIEPRQELCFANPDKFDPDNFLEDRYNKFGFLGFGQGPRHCIGTKA